MSLNKTKVKKRETKVDEKIKQIEDLTTGVQNMLQAKSSKIIRESIGAQLQLALAKADSEQLARQIAEEQLSDVEKEKTMLELEIKKLMSLLSRHEIDLYKKDTVISALEDAKHSYSRDVENLQREKVDLNNKIKQLTEEEEKLRNQVKEERLKKTEAVNKLAEIMNGKEFGLAGRGGKSKASEMDLMKRKEKEIRKLQQELTMERDKFNTTVERISEAQLNVFEGSYAQRRLQMELDAKDSDIEQLRQKIVHLGRAFVHSGNMKESLISSPEDPGLSDTHMEGWLAIPNRNNIKKYGWRKQYVVVSSRKVLFYNSETDKANYDPIMVLDIDKLFHVRPVTQGEAYRTDAKDIPRIFQVLYASEGEKRKLDRTSSQEAVVATTECAGIISYKGHDLIPLNYRTPTLCDSCHKHLWHVLHPPPALECKRCHVKIHREHFDKNEEFIAYCEAPHDSSIQAKEMLLLAESTEKQKVWVTHLSKKVSTKGIVSSGNIIMSQTDDNGQTLGRLREKLA